MRPRGTHGRASAWCLRSAGARELEARPAARGVGKEGGSRGTATA
jgi:hypothetical protein